MDWIVSLAETYAELERKLLRTDLALGTLLEPFSHVFEVESRRQQFKPTGRIRLLLIAESHVRMTDDAFRRGGCGFIYEPRYYTPWWHSLFLPAFGGDYLRRQIRSGTSLRAMALRQLQDAGVWVLDLSVLALSGYQKLPVGGAESRPLDAHRDEILRVSWSGHVAAQYEAIMGQEDPPIVATFGSAVNKLPPTVRASVMCHASVAPLKFIGMSNQARYADDDYVGGTATFAEAARRAGIATCLAVASCPRE